MAKKLIIETHKDLSLTYTLKSNKIFKIIPWFWHQVYYKNECNIRCKAKHLSYRELQKYVFEKLNNPIIDKQESLL